MTTKFQQTTQRGPGNRPVQGKGRGNMFDVTVLSAQQVEALLDMPMALDAVEQAYRLKSTGQGGLFPVVTHVFEEGVADLDIKSGELSGAGIFGLKLVSWFGGNPQRQIPALIGTILVFDSETGAPTGLISASQITGMRTGAASAIGSKYLARPDSHTLLLVGCGAQAPFQIMAHLEVFSGLEQVLVYNPLAFDYARTFCDGISDELHRRFISRIEDPRHRAEISRRASIPFHAVDSLPAALQQADIVVTITPSRKPIIESGWVRPGTHLSCMGADMAGKQETDAALIPRCRVYADDLTQSMEIGECEQAVSLGLLTREGYCGEIGQVIAGLKPGRQSAQDITLFDSTGIALQDLSTASALLQLAKKRGVGTTIAL